MKKGIILQVMRLSLIFGPSLRIWSFTNWTLTVNRHYPTQYPGDQHDTILQNRDQIYELNY